MTFVLEMAHVLPIVLHKMFDIVLRENNDNKSEWKGQKYPRPCELMGGRKLLWVWWRCNLSQFGPLLRHKSYQDKALAVMHLCPFTLHVMLLFQMRGGRCWNEWWCPDRVNKNWHGCLSALLHTAHHCCQPGQPQTQSKCWTQTTARHHFRSAEGPEMYSSFHFVTEGCTQNIYMMLCSECSKVCLFWLVYTLHPKHLFGYAQNFQKHVCFDMCTHFCWKPFLSEWGFNFAAFETGVHHSLGWSQSCFFVFLFLCLEF